MEWDQNLCLRLIGEFREREILWNQRHPGYYNKLKREQAWTDLAETFHRNTDEVKKKIESLKGSHRREKSRIRRSYASEREEIYVSKWFAYGLLHFLDDKEEPRVNTLSDEESEIRPPISQASSVPMVAVASRVQPTKPSRCTEKEDEFDIVGRRVAYQLRGMEEHQSLIAEKLVSDVMFQGRIGKLDENSFICLFPPNSSVSKLL